MRILLIIPNFDSDREHYFSNVESLGVQYICSSLIEKGHICKMINGFAYNYNDNEIVSSVIDFQPELIGISCPTQRSYKFTKRLIDVLGKNIFAPIFIGGFYATLAYKDILEDLNNIDGIVLGEGEITFNELANRIQNNKPFYDIKGIAYMDKNNIYANDPIRILDLDQLPFPERNIDYLGNLETDMEQGMNLIGGKFFRILSGRGCYGRCSFCSIIDYYQHKRKKIYRSATNVADEIELLYNTYGINKFKFNDEILYDLSQKGKKWVRDFCAEIERRMLKIEFVGELRANDVSKDELLMLKEIGLTKVSIGVESGVQRILDEMNKDIKTDDILKAISLLRECKIEPVFSFITIIPTMSLEELLENYLFMHKLGCFKEKNLYNKLNLYTGSPYIDILRQQNLLLPSSVFFERHNYIFKDARVERFSIFIKQFINQFGEDERKSIDCLGANDNYHDERNSLILQIIINTIDYLKDGLNVINFDIYYEYLCSKYANQIKRLHSLC